MNIQIDSVRISGFRGISNVEISLPRVAVLIGANNSGKTSIIKSLQLALGDYSRFLTDEDFYIDSDDKRQDKIVVDIRIISVNKAGIRLDEFSEEWQQEFGEKIQSEADAKQYVPIRSIASSDSVKGGFQLERYALERWPDFGAWQTEPVKKNNKMRGRFESVPFISIDAQRDIHSELKEKTSFVGRVLSSIEYDAVDVTALEEMVAVLNSQAVEKSDSLKQLKHHLDHLNHSFEGTGQTELTPFPKRIRDLSKRFSVNFGESDANSFSMEYHGMGTRSWASMLTVKAFTELMARKHSDEAEPFFPIIAAEEPEAHLHPNAQRTLYSQLINIAGQVIISTHSPYIAALADIQELRFLSKSSAGAQVKKLRDIFEDDDSRKIQREVVHSRGELLFSRAIVLSEGETEEQALPALFEAYMGASPFLLGINFVGVGGAGAKYRPFLILAKDLGLPVFIFSDGETKPLKELNSAYGKIFGVTDVSNASNITILDGTDFEGYLLSNGYQGIIESVIEEIDGAGFIDAWIGKRQGTPLSPFRTSKPPCVTCSQPIFEAALRDYTVTNGRALAVSEILDSKKPMYARAITDKLIKLPKDQFPPKIVEFFEKIKAGF